MIVLYSFDNKIINVYANYFTNFKYYDSDTNLPRLTK